MNNKKGFTLVEILVVVAILGIIALMAFTNVLGLFNNSKMQILEGEANKIKEAAVLYVEDYCDNPIGDNECSDSFKNATTYKDENGKEKLKYVCLSTLYSNGIIDEYEYDGQKCSGVVIYDEDGKNSEVYLYCGSAKNSNAEDRELNLSYFDDCGITTEETTENKTDITLTLDGNDGLVDGNETKEISVKKGKKYYEYLNDITASRIGYSFNNWYFKRNNDSEEYLVKSDTNIVNTNDHTLYAHWNVNNYIVTFNPTEGGSVSPTSKEVTFDSEYGELPISNKYGYTFSKWVYNNEKVIDSSTIVSIGNDHTVDAYYTPNLYTVKYDSNSGSACEDDDLVYEKSATLDTSSIKTGYSFDGWCTTSTLSTKVTKSDGRLLPNISNYTGSSGEWKRTQTTTLYASWKANTYIVNYNANGGSVSPSSGSQTYDSYYRSLPTPSRTGYTFTGWYTSPSGGTQVTTSTVVKITSTQTLYAHWTGIKVKVKLYNQYFLTNLITNGGFESNYTGWNIGANKYNSLDSSTAHSGSYSMKNTATAFDQQGILWANSGISCVNGHKYYGSLYQKSSNSIPVQNHIALGGNCLNLSGSTSTKWARFSEIITGGNSSLNYTALEWVNSSYSGNIWLDDVMVIDLTETFGSGNEPNQSWCDSNLNYFDTTSSIYKEYSEFTATYDSTYGSLLPTLTKSGYNFLGWYTSPSGGTQVTTSTVVKITSTQTLYARWKNAAPNIVLDGTTYSVKDQVNNNTIRIQNNGDGKFMVWIKATGTHTISFNKLTPGLTYRASIVAGGQSGKEGYHGSMGWGAAWAGGGDGGNGGQVINTGSLGISNNTNYSITIGGSSSNSSAFGYTAKSGSGGKGGSGGGTSEMSWDPPTAAKSGGTGTKAIDGSYYGGGGGGGGAYCEQSGTANAASGGTGGGAHGSYTRHPGSVINASANTGGGGGGGFCIRETSWDNGCFEYGSGGSGIIIIQAY